MVPFILSLFLGALVACQPASEGDLFWGSFGAGQPRILITQSLAGTEAVSMYDLNGNFISQIKSYVAENLAPDGIVAINDFEFFVTLDGADHFSKLNVLGEVLGVFNNTNFAGLLGQMTHLDGDLFMTESNTVESFKVNGQRIGNPRIGTTVGGCTLSLTRGIAVTANNYIAVVGTGNDDLNIYDVSDENSTTCIAANTTMGNLDPVSIIQHSDGSLYVATQGDDAVYRFNADGSGSGTSIFSPGTGTLNNPTALLELPDGSILVASDVTNNILRIDTSGNLLDDPFIQSSFTSFVGQMELIGGSQ